MPNIKKGTTDPGGKVNLGYEPDDPVGHAGRTRPSSDIRKSRCEKDVQVIKKNLASKGQAEPKVRKKRKITEKRSSLEDGSTGVTGSAATQDGHSRIRNNLFGDEEESLSTVSNKVNARKRRQRRLQQQESIEMTEMAVPPSPTAEEGQSPHDQVKSQSGAKSAHHKTEVVVTKPVTKKSKRRTQKDPPKLEPVPAGGDVRTKVNRNEGSSPEGNQVGVSVLAPSSNAAKKVLGVLIHYADCLKLDLQVQHPMVKVSLVNLSTGRLLAKSDRRQKVTSYYEGDNVRHVVPLMTQPFDFRKRKSMVPRWEEVLVFNDDVAHFAGLGQDFGIFFEILDFVSMSRAATTAAPAFNHHHTQGSVVTSESGNGANGLKGMSSSSLAASGTGGWHWVAWAFLKPVPSKVHSNMGKCVRLQLFKPGNLAKTSSSSKVSVARNGNNWRMANLRLGGANAAEEEQQQRQQKKTAGGMDHLPEAEVWTWWSRCQHVPYPSTLHVTVDALEPPPSGQPAALRSMTAYQPEYSSSSISNNVGFGFNLGDAVQGFQGSPSISINRGETQSSNSNLMATAPATWTGLPGQTCKIPNRPWHKLPTSNSKGAWCIGFSQDGTWLAAACPVSRGLSDVLIYETLTGALVASLEGHHRGPVYSLDWAGSGNAVSNPSGTPSPLLLLSGSGDSTAKVWTTGDGPTALPCTVSVLAHPSYVYSARFHPSRGPDLIATAGYDKVVRIWQRQQGQNEYAVSQELVGHLGYVNCLEFGIDGSLLFSGDSQGGIRIWESHGHDHPVSGPQWCLKKKLDFPELEGMSVSSISAHPGGRRLLVQTKAGPVSSQAPPPAAALQIQQQCLMIDLKLNAIILTCPTNQAFRRAGHTGSCITPCGTYVICGNWDGTVRVCNADTGKEEHVYVRPLGIDPPPPGAAARSVTTVSCVAFHPHDHIVAFSGIWMDAQQSLRPAICLFKYDRDFRSKSTRGQQHHTSNPLGKGYADVEDDAPSLITLNDLRIDDDKARLEKPFSPRESPPEPMPIFANKILLEDTEGSNPGADSQSEKLKLILRKMDQLIDE